MKVIKQIGGLSMLALLSPSAFALQRDASSFCQWKHQRWGRRQWQRIRDLFTNSMRRRTPWYIVPQRRKRNLCQTRQKRNFL